MKNKIELSYDDKLFSKEFKNKLFMLDTLNECNKMMDEILNKINEFGNIWTNEFKILNEYFEKKDFSNNFNIFSPREFYYIWVTKIMEYTKKNIHIENNDLSYYFWNSFPINKKLYDENSLGRALKDLSYKFVDSETSGDLIIFNNNYAYSHFKKLCNGACGYNDENSDLELLNKSNSIFELIEKIFDYILDRYLDFVEYPESKRKNIESFFTYTIEEENIEIKNKEDEKANVKKHATIMNIINIVLPGILIAPLAIGLFSFDDNTITFILLLIGDIIWLVIGITLGSNTCEKCGKYNSYRIVNEELLDSYVTTKTQYRINSRGESVPYNATVTMQKIEQKLCCQKCGDVKYKIIERER